MSRARHFTFGPFALDTEHSVATFTYTIDFEGGERLQYTDSLTFVKATKEMWERIPRPILSEFLASLTLLHGNFYWKMDCAPKIAIKGFSLSRGQARFWDEVYTKGMAEFFYRAKIDYRGLISFPHRAFRWKGPSATRFQRSPRSLLLNGGGKDTIVSAEMLAASNVPFHLFAQSSTKMQQRIADLIAVPSLFVRRRRDPKAVQRAKEMKVAPGGLFVSCITFSALLTAALWDYRYVIFSNEQSADIGNTKYLGLDVNHQWPKSGEAERMMRDYVHRFITPDITTFSLLRQFTEIEMTRRFTAYPKYFRTFCSCNVHFYAATPDTGKALWCNKCPKCVFIFACLSAFLPKHQVLEIFGTNLYADPGLLPTFRRLLGLEGIKPFECVGVPEEMIVAMHRAAETKDYDADAAIVAFRNQIPQTLPFKELEDRVLAPHGSGTVPPEFAAVIKDEGIIR